LKIYHGDPNIFEKTHILDRRLPALKFHLHAGIRRTGAAFGQIKVAALRYFSMLTAATTPGEFQSIAQILDMTDIVAWQA
jgi:hypothetical protein